MLKAPNLISVLTCHVEGSRVFNRYRAIDMDMKMDLVKIFFGGGQSRAKTGKSREKIIALLSENGKLTAACLAAEIGVTAKAIEKHLAKLKAEGIIEREGPDKGGSWKVK